MARRIRKAACTFTAAAIPAGIAAAFASALPAASAAPVAGAHRLTAANRMTMDRPGAPMLAAAVHRTPRRLRAYYWAQTQAGHPYVWGGTGPGYDCSGLVMMAYRHAGVRLPRTTSGMLASSLLRRVWHPRMGDLAFFGPWHVELFRKWGYTFGAHDPGRLVGLIHYGWGWVPTAFYRVR
jgi:cell wall-associated NlpC family hydrolase